MIPQYLSAKEIAAKLSCDEDWLYKRAVAGEIPSLKIGGLRRFREDEVLAYLEQNSEGELAQVHEIRGVSG